MAQEFVIFDKTESFICSVAKDAVTFGFLVFCIWFSAFMGGGFYTGLTATFLMLFVFGKASAVLQSKKTIKSKRAAIEWANSLSEDA